MAVHIFLILASYMALAAHGQLDDEIAELAAMVRENCADESSVDLNLVEKVNAGTDLATITDGKLKCYIKCTMETAGMMSDGVVDVEAVLSLLPDSLKTKNEASLKKCDTQKGSDDCDTAYLTQICWQAANKADYFLI
ncbi:general odorant-binding protein 69a-like [Bombyx mandarina]|uniref:General odorant-binding protein 69a-like n=1 Tax=Bombyx mandarina TaxID=7092 RepID=A0A6J2KI10_BOMMA|nr:general odorant-binding protein 69a-like [Bombyx mandarina]